LEENKMNIGNKSLDNFNAIIEIRENDRGLRRRRMMRWIQSWRRLQRRRSMLLNQNEEQ
jgi:hypothetical protein